LYVCSSFGLIWHNWVFQELIQNKEISALIVSISIKWLCNPVYPGNGYFLQVLFVIFVSAQKGKKYATGLTGFLIGKKVCSGRGDRWG